MTYSRGAASGSAIPTIGVGDAPGVQWSPTSILPQGTERYRALALLQVLDVATTWWILTNFSASAERNPVVAALVERGGVDAMMVVLLVVKLAVVWVLFDKRAGVNLVSAVYGIVVVNNLLVLVLVTI